MQALAQEGNAAHQCQLRDGCADCISSLLLMVLQDTLHVRRVRWPAHWRRCRHRIQSTSHLNFNCSIESLSRHAFQILLAVIHDFCRYTNSHYRAQRLFAQLLAINRRLHPANLRSLFCSSESAASVRFPPALIKLTTWLRVHFRLDGFSAPSTVVSF